MCLKLPPDAEQKQADYVMCADIFPTGWHATELAGMKPGDAVVIYGAGPVGLMAAHSAMIKGACSVMVVDCHADRLKLAESIGAIAIDYSKEDPVQRVMDLTHGLGADVGCECVGYQCHDHHHHRQERPNLTMNNLINSVKFTGGIGGGAAYSYRRTRTVRTHWRKRASSRSTGACSGSRGSAWPPASARSRRITGNCAT